MNTTTDQRRLAPPLLPLVGVLLVAQRCNTAERSRWYLSLPVCTQMFDMKNSIRSSQSAQVSLGSPTSPWAQDDVSFIKASQHRDQEAFALLVRKYQRPIFTLAFYILQDAEEASILTQETFLAAWKALPLFRGDPPFSLWLLHLTYQQCMQQQKQQTPEQEWQSKWHAALRQEGPYQKTMIEGENLSTLPTISRVVLILRYLQALTYEEMALVLSLPVRTIKAHLFRARTFLHEQGQSRQQRGG